MNPNLTTAIEFKCKQCNDLSFKNIVRIKNDKYAVICKNCIKKYLEENLYAANMGYEPTPNIKFDLFNSKLCLKYEEVLKIVGEELSPKYYNRHQHYGYTGEYFKEHQDSPFLGIYRLHSNAIILDSSLYHGVVTFGLYLCEKKIINKFKSKHFEYAIILNCNESDLHKILDAMFKHEAYITAEQEELHSHFDWKSANDFILSDGQDGMSEYEMESIVHNEYLNEQDAQYFDIECRIENELGYDLSFYNAEKIIFKYDKPSHFMASYDYDDLYKDVKNFLEWKKKKGY